MCHACSCSARVPNGAWMTPLHKDMSRSGQVVVGCRRTAVLSLSLNGDKGMNQTELQECHTWMSTVQRRVGAKKCQAAAPVDYYFVLARVPGQTGFGIGPQIS